MTPIRTCLNLRKPLHGLNRPGVYKHTDAQCIAGNTADDMAMIEGFLTALVDMALLALLQDMLWPQATMTAVTVKAVGGRVGCLGYLDMGCGAPIQFSSPDAIPMGCVLLMTVVVSMDIGEMVGRVESVWSCLGSCLC